MYEAQLQAVRYIGILGNKVQDMAFTEKSLFHL